MKIVQVRLRSHTGNETLTTWVDYRPELKVGTYITLKEFKPETLWCVMDVYGKVHDAADFDFHRKWDNNNYDKHKGLGV